MPILHVVNERQCVSQLIEGTVVTDSRTTSLWRIPRWVAVVVLISASVLSVGINVSKHVAVSPFDEYVYIDYLSKVSTQGALVPDEEVGLFARQELGCRGLRLLAPAPDSRCNLAQAENDQAFPMEGKTSADLYTPLYFAVTWAIAQPIQWLGVENLTDAGRFAGFAWLAAAAVLLYLTLCRLKVDEWASLGLTLLMIAATPTYWANTYVSTDASALLAGALVLYLATRIELDRKLAWLFVGVAPVLVLLKLQNFAAVAALGLFLLIRAWIKPRDDSAGNRFVNWLRDPRTLSAFAAIAASLVAQILWMLYRPGVGDAVYTVPDFGAALTERAFALEAVSILNSTAGFGDYTELGAQSVILSNVVQWAGLTGVIGLLVARKPGTLVWTYAFSALVAGLLVGPGLSLLLYMLNDYYFVMPPRYGLSLLPLFLLSFALLVRQSRGSSVAFAVLGVVCLGLNAALPAG